MTHIEIVRAAVCGTDLQLLNGDRPGDARILGHEGVGTSGGRFVVFNPVAERDPDVVLGHSYDGIFQEHLQVTAASAPETLWVSSSLVADLAPLIEPLGVALYAWELLSNGPDPPHRVGIWGCGPAAALNVLVALRNGSQPVLFHPSEQRLGEVLAMLGVQDDVESYVLGSLPVGACRAPLDAALLCVPRRATATALDQARHMCRAGGVLDLYSGTNAGGPEADAINRVRRRNTRGAGPMARTQVCDEKGTHWITGHRGTSLAHLRASESILLRDPEHWLRCISHVVGLDVLPQTLRRLADTSIERPHRSRRLKTVVDPTWSGNREPDPHTLLSDLTVRKAGHA